MVIVAIITWEYIYKNVAVSPRESSWFYNLKKLNERFEAGGKVQVSEEVEDQRFIIASKGKLCHQFWS